MFGASMKYKDQKRLVRLATSACGFCMSCLAGASPPFSRADAPVSRQEELPTTRLDLRPPGESGPTNVYRSADALASEPISSAIHYLDLGRPRPGTDNRFQPPAFGGGELNFRLMGRAHSLVRRIRRVGLPVGHLWETNSALLSIGLNQIGRPGLWLTHGIH